MSADNRKPLRFNEEMTAALVAGIKTVTRRPIRPQPETTESYLRASGAWVEGLTLAQHVNNAWRAGFVNVDCPYGEPGDQIRVPGDHGLVVEIVDIRIERLHDITEEQARAEGITDGGCCSCGNSEPCGCASPAPSAADSFFWLWDSIYGDMASNPWVWVIEFKRIAAQEAA
jgi:hypothetical protein